MLPLHTSRPLAIPVHLDVHLGLWGSVTVHAAGLPEIPQQMHSDRWIDYLGTVQVMSTTLHLEAIHSCLWTGSNEQNYIYYRQVDTRM